MYEIVTDGPNNGVWSSKVEAVLRLYIGHQLSQRIEREVISGTTSH